MHGLIGHSYASCLPTSPSATHSYLLTEHRHIRLVLHRENMLMITYKLVCLYQLNQLNNFGLETCGWLVLQNSTCTRYGFFQAQGTSGHCRHNYHGNNPNSVTINEHIHDGEIPFLNTLAALDSRTESRISGCEVIHSAR